MFYDRFDAANQLAEKLKKYKNAADTIIVAIPRGALEIGSVLCEKLNLPLDIVVTKKIGAPGNPEYAVGAVDPDGQVYLNPETLLYERIPDEYIVEEKKRLTEIIKEKTEHYRKGLPKQNFTDKTIILIDDGIATGFTMRAAIAYLRRQKAKKIILAIPVAAKDSLNEIKKEVDEVICLQVPFFFGAVAQFYDIFTQVEDEQAIEYLQNAHKNIVTQHL